MKINIKKMTKPIASYLKGVCWILSGMILLSTLVFLYSNCYQTIEEARTVGILKKQVSLNVVDMKLWKKINSEIEWKKQKIQAGIVKINPFD